MKECFESGTPESLPFPIAHAFITIVSNVSPPAQTQAAHCWLEETQLFLNYNLCLSERDVNFVVIDEAVVCVNTV